MTDDLNKLLELLAQTLNNGSETEKFDVTSKVMPDGHVIASLSRVPVPDFSWNPGEGNILDWRVKFDRKKAGDLPPFKSGEYVRVAGFVERDRKGLYKIHVDADGRIADNFYVKEVDAPDLLHDSIGMPLEVILEIRDERKEDFRISDIWNYEAKFAGILSKPAVNPDYDDIKDLQSGKRVIIQGTFVGFDESPQEIYLKELGYPKGSRFSGNSSSGYKEDGTYIVETEVIFSDGTKEKITLTNPPKQYNGAETCARIESVVGRIIHVEMPTGKINFSGGVLENLDHQSPEVGDQLRIAPFVTRRKNEGVEGKVRLAAYFCDPCYLDVPSNERREKYDSLRGTVASLIDIISSQLDQREYAEARKIIGEVSSLELSFSELGVIRAIVDRMPAEEKPMQAPLSRYTQKKDDFWIKSIDRAYHSRLESMTQAEFVTFAHLAVRGEISQVGEHADTSYLFQLAEDFGVDKVTREALADNCIEARFPKIRGRPYNHHTDFDDKYNIERAFQELAHIGTKSSSERIFEYLKFFSDTESYHKVGWTDNRDTQPVTFLYDVAHAISCYSSNIPLRKLNLELSYMQNLAAQLKENADESFTVDALEKIISYTEEANLKVSVN